MRVYYRTQTHIVCIKVRKLRTAGPNKHIYVSTRVYLCEPYTPPSSSYCNTFNALFKKQLINKRLTLRFSIKSNHFTFKHIIIPPFTCIIES